MLTTTAPLFPWWARWLALVAGALFIGALMIFAQTKHGSSGQTAGWFALIALLPILGPIIYFVAMTVRHRSQAGSTPGKGRSETMAPEEVAEAQRYEQTRRREKGGRA